MRRLDYFLDKKWLEAKKRNLNGERDTIAVFSKGGKPNFVFQSRLDADRYLLDYYKAFNWRGSQKTRRQTWYLELLSILIINNGLQETNLKKVHRMVESLSEGERPKNRDEFHVMNLIESLYLIAHQSFEFNENNFEIIQQLIFRNLGLSIHDKSKLYRRTETYGPFKNLVPPKQIESKLKEFFIYLIKLNKTEREVGGTSQAWIIFLTFIHISPFSRDNLIFAFILSKWYLYGLHSKFSRINLIYPLLFDWPDFVKTANEELKDLNFDASLKYLDRVAKNGVNIGYRLKIINDLTDNNSISNRLNAEIPDDFIEQTFLVVALFTYEQSLTKNQIIAKFRLNRHQILTNAEIEAILQQQVDNNLIRPRKVGRITYYDLVHPQLIKFKHLLKGK